MKREANFVVLPENGYAPLRGMPSEVDAGVVPVADEAPHTGLLIVNADDWGLDRETTDLIFQCALRKTVSSVSAMVFMEDSERAATMAQEHGIDAGLHLNLTAPFSASKCPARLAERQREIIECVRRHSFARVVFHPWMARTFEYVVKAQIEAFQRLYGAGPERIDGHHHMHLCSNVVFGGLLPPGIMVRRNFSFLPGEKSLWNRFYRKFVDSALAKRHRIADYFFPLPPLAPRSRLERIFSLANAHIVEMETHPARPGEFAFLMGDEILRLTQNVKLARRYAIDSSLQLAKSGRS
jgi:chitin disaccharide deacetylase